MGQSNMPASGQILAASTEILKLSNKLNNKNLNFTTMTESTIKEKMEKLLTDEIFNSEPCNIRLFATNVARLICEEMTGKYRKFHTPEIHTPVCGGHSCACIGYDYRVAQEMDKAQEILKALE